MSLSTLTPRQKMINMMYLVLTAMLALNISSEILKAFHQFEVSLEKSGKTLDYNNEELLKAMDGEAGKQGKKAEVYRDRAYETKRVADEFISYIQGIKDEFSSKYGGRAQDGQLHSADNLEAGFNYFFKKNDQKMKGEELMEKINLTRQKLIGMLDESERNTVISDLVAEEPKPNPDGVQKTWMEESFEMMPLAAVFANLTKYQNDARKTESDVIGALAKKINIDVFKIRNIQTIISSPSSSIITGQEYSADIILGAYDQSKNFEMKVNGNVIPVKDGIGSYKIRADREGVYKYKAQIMVPDPISGEMVPREAEGSYQVFTPQASVSVANMRVLYAGIDNPLDITVPGYRPDQISASGDNCELTGSGGQYKARTQVSQNRNAVITITARSDDGTVRTFRNQFTIRPLPPVANTVNGKDNGFITHAEAGAWTFVAASFGLYFPLNAGTFTVTSYTFSLLSKNPTSKQYSGNRITQEVKDAIARAKRGDKIIISDIKVVSTGTVPPRSTDILLTLSD
jgi:gliding motility-associated protein GldM